MQHEILEPSPLLDKSGAILQPGWARRPLLDCNLEDARVYERFRFRQRFRIKQWDYYGVMTPEGYFSATIADLGYAGQVFAYFVDYTTRQYHEETITIPLARGVELPRNSTEGSSRWAGNGASLLFEVDEATRRIRVEWPDFGGRALSADLTFQTPAESTVIVIPIGERRFYYNRKINCMPVGGTVSVGQRTIKADPDTSSGTLDWGRGVWAYSSFWVWASGSGFLADGRRVGLNLGYGFGDTSAATENTLILDGRIHKLAKVDFNYDDSDFMRPWRMESERLDVTFTPILERSAKTNLLAIRSEVHQMFGTYSGSAVDDAGDQITFDGVPGWAEEHHARW